MKKGIYMAVLLFAVMTLSACSGGKATDVSVEEEQQQPGTIFKGIYLSGDGNFTIEADETLWQAESEGESFNLYLKKDKNVWISFSTTDGLTADMVRNFEESFVNRYMEGIQTSYPDAKKVDSQVINDSLARIDMTMTYGSGLYSMYQILYLATDGQDGYLITSTLPQDEVGDIRPMIYKMIESIQFIK
ncbi:MAG: hypothetical protein RR225_02040 [Clostridium sp.]